MHVAAHTFPMHPAWQLALWLLLAAGGLAAVLCALEVKLAMYRSPERVLELLRQRLGPPAAATATLTGVRFDAP